MQHGVCRIELCCLVYFSAIVKNQSLKKNQFYDSICCIILLLRTASFFKFSLVKYHHSFSIQS